MKMSEYAMLASLAHGSKSGYDLTKWFERVASHFCTAGFGSVYPALARFEGEGLVVHEVVPSGRGPDRKVYSLTEAGREALLGWVGEPAAGPQTRDEQLVKALGYGMLPPGRVLDLLEEARDRHLQKLSEYEELGRALEARREAGEISAEAHLGTLLVLRRGLNFEHGYVAWCEEARGLVSSFAASGPTD